jgi:hypothetical protein
MKANQDREPELNPFAAPMLDVTDDPFEPLDRRLTFKWLLLWTVMLVINVPVCFLLGFGYEEDGSPFMVIGVSALWFFGPLFRRTLPRTCQALMTGSLITACFQFLPWLHMFAGIVSIHAIESMTGGKNDNAPLFPRVTLITISTGLIVMIAAMMIGAVVNVFLDALSGRRSANRSAATTKSTEAGERRLGPSFNDQAPIDMIELDR